jgi:hypothetical protein
MGYSQMSDAGEFDDFIFPLYDIGEDSRQTVQNSLHRIFFCFLPFSLFSAFSLA